ncbi:Fe-S cluster assembly protein SufD [Caenispirillum salinarum]|uniref:Fe-S cluster assembly protein SufD n=1 Tax=Caenispirillum salinarum TaxID=859058 RepID=UPI00384EABE0
MAETNAITPAALSDTLPGAGTALPGGQIAWVRHAREEGAKLWQAHGAPTVKVEQWKYTNLRDMLKVPFRPARPTHEIGLDTIPAGDALTLDAHVLVFVNGQFSAEMSDLDALPKGVAVSTLATLLETEPHAVEPFIGRLADAGDLPFAALNQGALEDGFVVRVKTGTTLEKPLHIVQVSAAEDEPTAHQPRNVVVLENGAVATVVESWIGTTSETPTLRNAVTEIHVAPDAVLTHQILQNLPETAYNVAATAVKVEAKGVYDSFVLQVGGKLSRHDLRVELAGRHAECRLNGAYGASGTQHMDTTSFIDHAAPECTSNEIYKGVLAGKSRGVFQGKILVRREAQQTDGNQLHKALLLERGAEVDTKPELEIYADDVTCSHGATTGELDPVALFYLRSRGIDPETARMLLIEGFLDDVVERIPGEANREAFKEVIHRWQRRRIAEIDPALG